MERNEISSHEVSIFATLLRNANAWISAADIAEQAQVAPRTARAHAHKFVQLNILDQAEVFPGHRYRISASAAKRNRGYYDRLVHAAEVFGIQLTEGASNGA